MPITARELRAHFGRKHARQAQKPDRIAFASAFRERRAEIIRDAIWSVVIAVREMALLDSRLDTGALSYDEYLREVTLLVRWTRFQVAWYSEGYMNGPAP